MPSKLKDPLTEVDNLIKAIRKNIQEAEDDDFPNHAAIEKMRGRELAALRLRSNIILQTQKNTARLLDSPEWIRLAEELSTHIAECDRCSNLILPILLPHMTDNNLDD